MLSTGFEARRQAKRAVSFSFYSATLLKCARVFCHPYQGDGGGASHQSKSVDRGVAQPDAQKRGDRAPLLPRGRARQ